jgi:hypothetical protein
MDKEKSRKTSCLLVPPLLISVALWLPQKLLSPNRREMRWRLSATSR